MAPDETGTVEEQSRLIRALLKRECFPHPVSSIEVFETHISWVIATGPFAYKIKKAVNLGFLDFSTLRRRKFFCEEELRLNQQWAPELYLAVVPVCGSHDRPSVAGEGVAIEYAVKMVQFPQSAQLDKQLNAGLLHEKDLYDLAETVAGYHGKARIIEYADERESVKKVKVPMLDNFAPVAKAIDMDLLTRVQKWTSTSLYELKPNLVQRRKNGFVRECHGDLHLANLVRLSRGIVPFDCVEFSADLRNIDVLSDIAFLVMDLVAGARQDLAYAFLNRYLECTGDYDGMRVFGLYFVYHCMIRAKVAAIRSTERANAEERRHDIEGLKHNLAVAIRWIQAPVPRLLAMHGYSGSGKTWLSSQLMTQLPAIRVRSDVERKRLFDLDETASSDSKPGMGIYTKASSARVYDALIEKAERLLGAGFSVIIDASFLRRADRQLLVSLADRQNLDHAILDTSAERVALEQRLRNRSVEDQEVSEADIHVLEHQFDTADALTAAEVERTVRVPTDRDVDIGDVIKSLRSIGE
jgi:aminoglycoside phosphotransferase family enzyme/predicted kinase